MGTGKTENQPEMIFSKGDIVIIPVPFTDNKGYKL